MKEKKKKRKKYGGIFNEMIAFLELVICLAEKIREREI